MQLTERTYTRNPIQALSNGTVLLDYGPMHMFIGAFENGRPVVALAEEGARFAMKVLEDLARFLPVVKKKSDGLEVKEAFPDVVRRMIEATKKMEEPDLTPLAAVAGTASDVVADFIFGKGGTKIIVDNGGDIAIRLREGEVANVGIKTEIDAKQPAYLISIESAMIGESQPADLEEGVSRKGSPQLQQSLLGHLPFLTRQPLSSGTLLMSKMPVLRSLWQRKSTLIPTSLENGSRPE